MNFQTFHLFDSVGCLSPLQIHPTFSMKETRLLAKDEAVTLGGQFHTYLPGRKGYEWSLPLTFVNSADRSKINAWWSSQAELIFCINASSTPQSALVRIANIVEPLGQNVPAYPDLFNGGLILHLSRGGGIIKAMGFILDDPVWGKLDQTYNALF